MGKILTFIGGAASGIIGLFVTGLCIDKIFYSNTDMSSVPDNEGNIDRNEDLENKNKETSESH